MAVLAIVYAAADVEPPRLGAGLLIGVMLQYQLVVIGVLLGVFEQQADGLLISAVGEGTMLLGYGYVGSLAAHVLRVFYTAHQRIKLRAAVSAAYLYGQSQSLSQRLKAAHT